MAKKYKEIVIKLDPKNYPFDLVTHKLSCPQRAVFKDVVKQEKRVLKEHFTKRGHGWDLDWRLIQDGIYAQVFGSTLEAYLMATMLKATGATLVGTEKGLYLKKRAYNRKKRSKR